jgi:hypothetical protein
VNVQVSPTVQPLLDAPVGVGQAVHCVPQEFGLVSGEQMPLQLCEPVGHWAPQAAVESIQVPLQSRCVPGQVPPHTPAVQVAVPPVTVGQGVQELPQLAGSVLLRHFPAVVQ